MYILHFLFSRRNRLLPLVHPNCVARLQDSF